MPPLCPYPNVLKVRTRFTVASDIDVGTTVHFTYTGPAPTDAQMTTLATAIYGAAVTHLVPVLGSDRHLSGVQVTDLTSPTSGYGEHIADTDGSRAGTPLPAQTCALLNVSIARRYRGGKPRGYWPFGTSLDLPTSGGAWGSTALSDFNTAIGDYLNAIVALPAGAATIVAFCSISYYEGFTTPPVPPGHRAKNPPTPRAVAIAPDVALTFSINPKPATQRRRQLYSV